MNESFASSGSEKCVRKREVNLSNLGTDNSSRRELLGRGLGASRWWKAVSSLHGSLSETRELAASSSGTGSPVQ